MRRHGLQDVRPVLSPVLPGLLLNVDPLSACSTVATLFKHVGAYGVAAGGMNGGRADVTEHTVREQYLKPWRRAAASGARGVMPR